jgi:hypothetical protein
VEARDVLGEGGDGAEGEKREQEDGEDGDEGEDLVGRAEGFGLYRIEVSDFGMQGKDGGVLRGCIEPM